MIGQPQIFGADSWSYIDRQGDVMPSGHRVQWFLNDLTTTPINFVIVIATFYVILSSLFDHLMPKMGITQ